MAESSEENRQRKLSEFVESLKRPVSERYFPEDDLAFIFDLAHEEADYYLMNEALLLGARLYPESRMLLARRALYYKHEDDDEMTLRRHLENNPAEENDIIGQLLTLQSMHPESEEAILHLDRIVDGAVNIDDEEIIQLCDVAWELGCFGYIIGNLDKLKAKCQYPPTLYFEVAQIAKSDYPEIALEMCNRLVDIEPYNIDFWVLYGSVSLDADDYTKAMEASEIALAIDPGDENAVILRLKVMALSMPDKNDADFATRMMVRFPDSAQVNAIGLALLKSFGRNQKASELCKKFFDRHPDNKGAAWFLITESCYNITRIVKHYLQSTDAPRDNGDTVYEWVERLYGDGLYLKVTEVWEAYSSLVKPVPVSPFHYIMSLYMCGCYERLADGFEVDMKGLSGEIFLLVWVRIHSLLVTGRIYEARKVIDGEIDESLHFPSPPEKAVMHWALVEACKKVKYLLDSNIAVDWSEFSPFGQFLN